MNMELWKRIIKKQDKQQAKNILKDIRGLTAKGKLLILDYKEPISDKYGYITSHAKRILIEMDILSVWGKTSRPLEYFT